MLPASLPILAFANNAGQILEDAAEFLRIEWSSRPCDADDARSLFDHLLEALRRRGWSRVLVNQIGMAPFTPDEQQWVAHDWLPRAVQAGGYRHGAVIVSPDVFVRLATTFVTSKVQDLALTYRTFNFEAEAVRWLLQQPRTPQG